LQNCWKFWFELGAGAAPFGVDCWLPPPELGAGEPPPPEPTVVAGGALLAGELPPLLFDGAVGVVSVGLVVVELVVSVTGGAWSPPGIVSGGAETVWAFLLLLPPPPQAEIPSARRARVSASSLFMAVVSARRREGGDRNADSR
jgi:hypothetical protein